MKTKSPIIITGCPRTGTQLTARLIGHKDFCLITEHVSKRYIPEDKSGIMDCQIWWDNFKFEYWNPETNSPLVETPIYNKKNIEKVKNIYQAIARGRRLVIKNPYSILRIPIIKEMFPDALIVFCVRNPWHTMQSIIRKRKKGNFTLNSEKNFKLPNDLLLKAVTSWAEAIDIYQKERDENWYVVKYENLIFDTKYTIKNLFKFLDMENEKAFLIPKDLKHNYYPIKKFFKANNYQLAIMEILKDGCKLFNYSTSLDSIETSMFKYYIPKIKKKLRLFLKLIKK